VMISGEPTPENLVYLFCLADKIPKTGPETGYDGKGISYVSNKGLYAVTGIVTGDDFCQENLKRNLNDFKWVEEKVRLHEQVVEKTMSASTVMPFKFGTVFKSEESLKKMLDEYLDEFREILKRLEGKREWGIKVYCDRKAFARLVEKDAPFDRMEKETELLSPGRAFFHKKKQDQLMAEFVDAKTCEASREIFEILKGHSTGTRINNLLPPDATSRKEDMVFNAAFLVDNGRAGAFIDEVELLRDKYFGFEIECTGPWPPYNFCVIKEHESADRK